MSLDALPGFVALPPLNLLAVACAGAALRRRRLGGVLLWGGLGGLVLLGLPIVSGSLMAALESGLGGNAGASDARAIVILSADEQRILQAGKIAWTAGPLTLQRDRAGAALARRTGLPVLVSGGSMRPDMPALASVMTADLKQDFATDVRWQEAGSLDTWQNARRSAILLRRDGISDVYVVTHAWHMKRALTAFRRAGLRPVAAPVQIDAVPEWRAASFVPSVHALQDSAWAIHEFIGWAWYAVRP